LASGRPGGPAGGPKTAVFSCGRPYKGPVWASGRPRGPPGARKPPFSLLPALRFLYERKKDVRAKMGGRRLAEAL
jgi:hypothetical protein